MESWSMAAARELLNQLGVTPEKNKLLLVSSALEKAYNDAVLDTNLPTWADSQMIEVETISQKPYTPMLNENTSIPMKK